MSDGGRSVGSVVCSRSAPSLVSSLLFPSLRSLSFAVRILFSHSLALSLSICAAVIGGGPLLLEGVRLTGYRPALSIGLARLLLPGSLAGWLASCLPSTAAALGGL